MYIQNIGVLRYIHGLDTTEVNRLSAQPSFNEQRNKCAVTQKKAGTIRIMYKEPQVSHGVSCLMSQTI